MQGLITLVISMSTNLNVEAYNDILRNLICIATVCTELFSIHNMTVSLCIRQESKRNDDSVSVEELDWSAESS